MKHARRGRTNERMAEGVLGRYIRASYFHGL